MLFVVVLSSLLWSSSLGVASEQTATVSIPPLTGAISPSIANVSVVPVVPAVNSLSLVNLPLVPTGVISINITRSAPATPTGRCRSLDLLSGTPCILSDCGRFRSIECNEATDGDLSSVFATYDNTFGQATRNQSAMTSQPANQSTSGPRPSGLPLVIRLNGGMINRTSSLFGPLAEQVVKLELNQVAMPTLLPEGTFADLKNLVTLNLNGIVTDTLSAGTFKNLTSLQSLSIDSPTSLRLIQRGALDPERFPALKCMRLKVSSPRFLCDCDTNTWLQKALINSSMLMNRTTWNDMYMPADANSSAVSCGVNIVCSGNSNEPFRRNMADINLGAVCSIPTTTVATTSVDTTTTAATTAAPRTTVIVQQNAPAVTTAANGSPSLFSAYPALFIVFAVLIAVR